MSLSPTRRIAKLFEAAGYKVDERLGQETGCVDFIATPRAGVVRSRIYFRTLPGPPEDLDAERARLEEMRGRLKVDSAIGVVMAGTLPEAHVVDLASNPVSLLTYRRFLLELAGIPERLRTFVVNSKNEPPFPLRAQRKDGRESEVYEIVEEYLSADHHQPLVLLSSPLWVADDQHILWRAARRFLAEPERALPLYDIEWLLDDSERWRDNIAVSVYKEILKKGYLTILLYRHIDRLRGKFGQTKKYVVLCSEAEEVERIEAPCDILAILEPTPREVGTWLASWSLEGNDRDLRLLFEHAVAQVPGFAEFIWDPKWHKDVRRTLREMVQLPASAMELAVKVIDDCCDRNLAKHETLLIDGALDDYLLGRPLDTALNDYLAGRSVNSNLVESFFELMRALGLKPIGPSHEMEAIRFTNQLVRDCLIARKMAREWSEGRTDLLLRHPWPEATRVLLALKGVPVGSEPSSLDVLREQAAREAERRLSLELAHTLKRPIGTIDTYLKELREQMDARELARHARALRRIEEEVQHLQRISAYAHRLEKEPAGEFAGVLLRDATEQVSLPLRSQHPRVAWHNDVPAEIRVRAKVEALRDVLFHLVENAFHAAGASSRDAKEVRVTARLIEDTVRLEILDSGDGVRPADRERIFDRYVSTKTGGSGKPSGTGLGLAIAKKSTELMGGRIGLDPAHPPTCFYLELVRWEET